MRKRDKKINELKKEIEEFKNIETSLKTQLKELSIKGSAVGQKDRAFALGIIRDKRIKAEEELGRLQEQMETSEDKVVAFSEETCRKFMQWLEKEGKGLYLYLHMIRFHPNVLERIIKEEIPTEEISLDALVLGIVEQYLKKNNLEIRKKEEKK